jgi:phosphatidylglycerophosphate synthase
MLKLSSWHKKAARVSYDRFTGYHPLTYDYRKSLKSSYSDELINTYVLRPLAGLVVRGLYRTPVTPNQVTIASAVAGFVAAALYLKNEAVFTAIAGLCVTLKDVLDSADGQLARARQQNSRTGRFLDSLGDFFVDTAVFAAIGWALFSSSGDWRMIVLSTLALAGITLRVSYHVFYHTSFLHLEEKYDINRVTEDITVEDQSGDPVALRLQKVFQLIYGWQDHLMLRIDTWCRRGCSDRDFLIRWYSDRKGLMLSGLVGLGTELFLLMVCSLLNELALYLILNVFFMSGIALLSVFYRRWLLSELLLVKG